MVSLVFQQLCDLPSRRTSSVQSRTRLMSMTAEERAILHNPACPACEVFARERVILPCQVSTAALPLPLRDSTASTMGKEPLLRFSEPLLTGWSCEGCGSSADMFTRARHHDSSLLWCPQCGAATRAARILDEATPSSLATLAAGRPLPLSYLIDATTTPIIVLSLNHQTNQYPTRTFQSKTP